MPDASCQLPGSIIADGSDLAFDCERNYRLPNLFVSMLQRMGIEDHKFASSTSTMSSLEMANA